jgi:hypothetical protein
MLPADVGAPLHGSFDRLPAAEVDLREEKMVGEAEDILLGQAEDKEQVAFERALTGEDMVNSAKKKAGAEEADKHNQGEEDTRKAGFEHMDKQEVEHRKMDACPMVGELGEEGVD